MKKNVVAAVVAFTWFVFVTILLCIPGSRLPKIQEKMLDKWAHIFLFFVLVVLFCRVYVSRTAKGNLKNIFISITIGSIVYGIIMEIIQHYFVPFRSFDFWDMIADAIGSAAGYLISLRFFIKKEAPGGGA